MLRAIDQDELPKYMHPILLRVRAQTGYLTALKETPGLEDDARLTVGYSDHPLHLIEYAPRCREHQYHFLLSGALKALRFWEAEPEERLVPGIPIDRGLPESDERELRAKLKGLDSDDVTAVSHRLFQDLAAQVAWTPYDLRIEREIADKIPQHQETQQNYLSKKVISLKSSFDERIAEVIPERLYEARIAMYLVHARQYAEMAGNPSLLDHVPQNPSYGSLADSLQEGLHDASLPTYAGSRRVIDAWADRLGLRGWYDWIPLEAIDA